MCFCLEIWGVLDSTNSAEKKMVCWKRRQTGKIRCSVRCYVFAWDIEMFSILIERTNSKRPCKISYSSKDLPIFLGILKCYFAAFTNLLLTGKMMMTFFILNELTGRYLEWPGELGYLLNNWISREKHLLWIFFMLQDTWISRRMNLI